MIKLDNRFYIEKDKYNWILVEFVNGVSKKTKEATVTEKKTYYGKLSQCLESALNKGLKKSKSINEILQGLNKFSEIARSLK